MVLVDSSVWIESLRPKGDMRVKLALEGLLDTYEALWCAPVRLEVIGGARREERNRLGRFFSVIPYRPFKEEDWNRAISLAWSLRGKGLNLPWLDVLIASIAIHDDVRVYSIDKHFEIIAQNSSLFLYKPGYGGMFRPENEP